MISKFFALSLILCIFFLLGPAVRNKWKSLRDKFRTTLASIPKPKSGDAANDYRGEWKYFKSLLFLKDQFTPRNSTGNLPKNDDENICDDILQISQDESDKDVSEQTVYEDDTTNSSRSQFELNSAPSSTPTLSRASSSRKHSQKRTSADEVGQALLQVERQKLEYLEQKRSRKEEDDEDLNFFKSLLPHVKTFSAFDKLEYRMRVMKITKDFLQKDATLLPLVNNADADGSSFSGYQPTVASYYNAAGSNLTLLH